jgi:CheY-like chemotaxis protein
VKAAVQPLGPQRKHVLVVDDDRDVAEVVQTILIDEGFKVSCLYLPSEGDLKAAIDRLEPDCILLDGGNRSAYGPSWDVAAWLVQRARPIPTVMLTAHTPDREEAMLDTSARAHAARIAGVIPKPFDLDQLVSVVHKALGDSVPDTDRDEAEHAARLLERLRAAGAQALTGSELGRVWASFQAGTGGDLYKVYRWRLADAYFVGRYGADGQQMEPLAQLADLEALIAFCVARIKGERLHQA